jgi:hypothetical protein
MGRSEILNDDSQKKRVFLKFPGSRRENSGGVGNLREAVGKRAMAVKFSGRRRNFPGPKA